MKKFATFVMLTLLSTQAWANIPVVSAEDNANAIAAGAAQADQNGQTKIIGKAQPETGDILLQKLQQLTSQVKKLQGKLEVQAHDLAMLRAQQRAFYNDLDERLNKQSKLHTLKQQPNTKKPNIKLKPAVLPSVSGAVSNPTQSNIINNNNPLTKTSAAQQYQKAFTLVRSKQYPAALKAMQAFIKAHPDSSLVSNAHYWLGELQLTQKNDGKALIQFQQVVNQYSKSPKVPAALLKIGFIYAGQGKTQLAREQFIRVRDQFPDTAPARLASARLQAMDQAVKAGKAG